MNAPGEGGWTLRLARSGDAEALSQIEGAANSLYEGAPEVGTAGTHVMSAQEYRTHIGRGHCLVAEADGRPVGFVAAKPEGRELYIAECNVHPAYQRRGIGAALLRAAMVDARNSGFNALTLTTFRHLPWNMPFYAALGFVELTDPDAHPTLGAVLAREMEHGLSRDKRVAMIRFLD